MAAVPSGCPFRTRCTIGRHRAKCADERPPLVTIDAGHDAACHFVDEVADWAASDPFGDRPPGRAGA